MTSLSYYWRILSHSHFFPIDTRFTRRIHNYSLILFHQQQCLMTTSARERRAAFTVCANTYGVLNKLNVNKHCHKGANCRPITDFGHSTAVHKPLPLPLQDYLMTTDLNCQTCDAPNICNNLFGLCFVTTRIRLAVSIAIDSIQLNKHML